MKVLKFTLKGKTAFFKKPDVNTYLYFTYGNIHKCALLGIFGSILGYGGYNQNRLKAELNKDKYISLPEYYQKLKDIKISIMPDNEKGSIPKKIQSFNNSVGYASKEAGGNLIVKEQWLENPSWTIYLLIDREESTKIADAVINRKAIFNPYLGKNDHVADIENARIIDSIQKAENVSKLDCLAPKENFNIVFDDDDDDYEDYFKYEESLPVALDENTSLYVLKKFFYTNMDVESKNIDVFNIEEKNIVFY